MTRIHTAVLAAAVLVMPSGAYGPLSGATARTFRAGSPTAGTKFVNIQRFTTQLDAVRIAEVSVAGERVRPGLATAGRVEEQGEPFQADENWLKNMSISLKNRTEKTIICAQVELWFPDTGNGSEAQPVSVYMITVGQMPEWARYYRDGSKMALDPTRKAIQVDPGETLVVKLSNDFAAIQNAVEEKMLFAQISRVNISIGNIYFSDGMRWDGEYAAYFVPDAQHPGHDTKLGKNFFPGKSSREK